MSYFELLKKIEIFSKLSLLEINLLSAICEEKEYSIDKVLVEENKRNSGLFLIRNGTVAVYKTDGSNRTAISELIEGGSFGEMSLVDDFPASASIATKTQVSLLFISKEVFQKFIAEHISIGLKIYQNICGILSTRLRETDKQLAVKKSPGTTRGKIQQHA